MHNQRHLLVCQYRNCLQRGSAEVLTAFQVHSPTDVVVTETGCLGQCSSGPTVRITPDEIWYCRVQPHQVNQIVQQHLKEGQPVEALMNPRVHIRF